MMDPRRAALGAIQAWNLHAAQAAPPAPPLGAQPARFGNGRVELLIYAAATEADRIAGAVTLLAGTPFHVTPRPETTR